MRRLLAGLALAAALVVTTAPPASAHAVLLAASPGDGARLEEAPPEVRLEFSEAIGAGLGALRVFDTGGERVDTGAVDASGSVVSVPLEGGLGDGAYIVTYRVVSADSHPVRGALTFTVGDAEAAGADVVSGLQGEDEDRAWEITGAAFRVLAYAGALVAAGLAAFLVLAHDGGDERPGLRRVVRVAAAAGAVGVLAALPVQAALATGLGAGALFEDGVLSDVLGDGLGLSTAVLLAGSAGVALDAGRRRAATVPAAVAATAGFALAGHTTGTDPRWLVTASAAVHAAAAAVWLGGLIGVIAVVRRRRGTDDATGTAAVVTRFSAMAAVTVAVVAAAGTLLAWREVRAVDALTSTTYGKVLLVKIGLAAVVFGIAAWNRFRLVPVVARKPAAMARLGRLVRFEAALLLGVLAVTGALVQITPARVAAGVGSIFSATVPLGEGELDIVVDPNRAGANSIHLYLFDEGGRPLDPLEVGLELSLPANALGPIAREPFVAGPGHYQLDGGDLSIAGRWTIEVVARLDRFTQDTATVEVPVNP